MPVEKIDVRKLSDIGTILGNKSLGSIIAGRVEDGFTTNLDLLLILKTTMIELQGLL